jgi:hypothetical protein
MDTLDAVAQKLSRDPAVWARVQTELAQARDPKARLIELAREQGMTVDASALDQAVAAAGGELNENQLESVAGGFNPQPDPPGAIYSKVESQILIGLLLPAVQKVRG